MQVALSQLPLDQREALILVTASDMSYEEAAAVCGVAVGTIKSRVSRARAKLSEILKVDDASEFGPTQEPGHHRSALTVHLSKAGHSNVSISWNQTSCAALWTKGWDHRSPPVRSIT